MNLIIINFYYEKHHKKLSYDLRCMTDKEIKSVEFYTRIEVKTTKSTNLIVLF